MSRRLRVRVLADRHRPPPVEHDPTATYDALHRKQPKRIGFLTAARALPAMMGHFNGEVPQERIVVTEDRQAVFECACGEVVYAAHDAVTDCQCGREFVFIGRRVLAHRPVG